jgi:protein-disulfide isomerase
MTLKSILAAAIAAVLSTQAASALDLNDMNAQERAAFGAAVRSYILENPELIMEAVQVLRDREAAAEAQSDFDLVAVNANDIFNDGYSYVGGNPNGDVVLVEFMDYRCGYCRKAYQEVEELLASDGNIRFIVKEFPILGEASTVSSEFAIAVKQLHGDDIYKKIHDALIAFTGEPTDASLGRLAENFGLDAQQIFDQMKSDDVQAIIADTRALAARLKINGTPTFVMQDQLLRGYAPLDVMRQLVADKRG